jgi:pSer/pThr/pTyr-binding forkhead associated (FHA) protein
VAVASGPAMFPSRAPAPQPAPVAPLAAPAQAAAAPGAGVVVCPQCSHVNTTSNMFCGSCGFRLGSGSPRPAATAQPAPAAEPGGSTITLTALRADGSEAGTFQLPGGNGTVGRETGGIFAGDSYLSPRHATFRAAGLGRAVVRDDGSLNGVYKKLGRDVPIELRPNEVFRIGQEIIKFEPLTLQPPAADGVERLGAPSKGYVGRIALVIGREETGNAFPIPEGGVHLGRERGDILFPEDGYVSGLHCRLTWDGQRLFLTDLGSSNGTFVRIAGEADIRSGDVLLMGQQLFRVAI